MITFSIIQKSKLEEMGRIDADYYQPEYLDLEKRLLNIPTEKMVDISTSIVNFGAYSLCNYIVWQESGIPYLNVENIKDGYIDFENIKYIDDKVNEILSKSKVKEGQIVLPMAGTIGNSAVAYKVPAKINSNQATAKITLKKNVSPFYVIAFLNSYYGKTQIVREILSSVQPNIFLWQIKNLKVPLISNGEQKEIEALWRYGLEELDNSKQLYLQAEELLLEELGLKNTVFEDELSSVVNFSDVQKANRIDPEYFRSKYKEIIEKIEKYEGGWDVLEKAVRFKDNNFTPREDEKYKYLALSNISSQGYVQNYQEELGKNLPSRARRKINTGDVIISSIEGSLSSCAIIEDEFNNAICSTGFFVLNSEKINPETLLILFKSNIMQELLQRGSKGTILTAISKMELEYIKIPLIKLSLQKQIAEIVRKSHEARKKSKELLEEAKRKVEEMIEEGNRN